MKPEYWASIKFIKISGNQSKLALKLGIKQQSISRWFKYGVSVSRAHQIKDITEGLIKATDLCEGAKKKILNQHKINCILQDTCTNNKI